MSTGNVVPGPTPPAPQASNQVVLAVFTTVFTMVVLVALFFGVHYVASHLRWVNPTPPAPVPTPTPTPDPKPQPKPFPSTKGFPTK